MGKKKIVVDTNILISAFGWDGLERLLFEKVLDDEFELIISPEQLDELTSVLDYPKFNFNDEQKQIFLSIIYEVATMIEIPGELKIIQSDPDDNIILETALIGKADYLISGNDHLLDLKEYSHVKILRTRAFLELF